MKVSTLFAGISLSICLSFLSYAQAAPANTSVPFQKENVYGVWSKDVFADASIVQGPHKIIYVAGMSSEDPASGEPTLLGDFAGQCKMAYDKIRKILKAQGGDMNNIVRTTVYVIDIRYFGAYMTCQKEALGTAPLPPHTMLNVNQLAWPGLMVEVEVTAVVAEES